MTEVSLNTKAGSPPLAEDSLRSTKKVRIRSVEVGDKGTDQAMVTEVQMVEGEQVVVPSYKNMLLNAERGGSRQTNDLIITDADYCISRDGDIPSIEFSQGVRDVLVEGMEHTIVIKLLGHFITYRDLVARTQSLWQTKGSYHLVDMEKNFFLATFDLEEDYTKVLTGGPRMIFGAYLTKATLKALIPWIKVDGKTYGVQYEGLPHICFECGRYGHMKDKCKEVAQVGARGLLHDQGSQSKVSVQSQPVIPSTKTAVDPPSDLPSSPFGSWMKVTYPKKGNKQNLGKDAQTKGLDFNGGSRYNVLYDCDDLAANGVQVLNADLVEVNRPGSEQMSKSKGGSRVMGPERSPDRAHTSPKQGHVKSRSSGAKPNQVYRKKMGETNNPKTPLPGPSKDLADCDKGNAGAHDRMKEAREVVIDGEKATTHMVFEKAESEATRFLSSAFKALETSSSLDSNKHTVVELQRSPTAKNDGN
ncbi:hypothetical protein K1719_027937 [Acacia pycnantha]|nr:hypothetical protein K1719_027937 [Acacia pycnantha]